MQLKQKTASNFGHFPHSSSRAPHHPNHPSERGGECVQNVSWHLLMLKVSSAQCCCCWLTHSLTLNILTTCFWEKINKTGKNKNLLLRCVRQGPAAHRGRRSARSSKTPTKSNVVRDNSSSLLSWLHMSARGGNKGCGATWHCESQEGSFFSQF